MYHSFKSLTRGDLEGIVVGALEAKFEPYSSPEATFVKDAGWVTELRTTVWKVELEVGMRGVVITGVVTVVESSYSIEASLYLERPLLDIEQVTSLLCYDPRD